MMKVNSNNNVSTITEQKRVLNVDDAMDLTGYGKFNLRVMALAVLMCLALVLEIIGFSYIIPASQCDLNLSLTLKGVVGALPFICMIVTSYPWGYLADTKGRRICLVFSLAFGSIFSMLSSFAPDLISFVCFRIVSALFSSGSSAIIYAYVGEFGPKSVLDRSISIMSAFLVWSVIVASGLAWLILPNNFRLPISFLGIDYRPWRLVVLVYAIPSALSAIFVFISTETPKFLLSKGKSEESLKILRHMFAVNFGKPESDFPVDILTKNESDVDTSVELSFIDTVRKQTIPLFLPPNLYNLLKIFTIQFGVLLNGNGFLVWLPEIFNRFVKGYSSGNVDGMRVCDIMMMNSKSNETLTVKEVCNDSIEVGTYTFMIATCAVIGAFNIFIAFTVQLVGKRIMLLTTFGFCAIMCLAVNFIYNPIVGMVFFCCMFLQGTMMGVSNSFSVELFPTHLRGMAVSLSLMSGRLGSLTGTNLVGYLIESNCTWTFYYGAVIIIVCFVTSWFLPSGKIQRETKQQTKL